MGRSGLGFHYATTLSALHFLSAGVTVLLTQGKGSGKGNKLPLRGEGHATRHSRAVGGTRLRCAAEGAVSR